MADTTAIEAELDKQTTWEKVFILVRYMNINVVEQPRYKLSDFDQL